MTRLACLQTSLGWRHLRWIVLFASWGHGIINGTMNAAMGGSFSDGFINGMVSKVVSIGTSFLNLPGGTFIKNAVQSMIVGAVSATVTSSMTGSDWGQNVMMAAIGHMYNGELKALMQKKALLIHGSFKPKTSREMLAKMNGGKLDAYYQMIDDAKEAGYTVYENATAKDLMNIWESNEYDQLLYYTHGKANGNIAYDHNNRTLWNPLTAVFNTERGSAANLTVCSCFYNQTVTPHIQQYSSAGINLRTHTNMPTFAGGKVWVGNSMPWVSNYVKNN